MAVSALATCLGRGGDHEAAIARHERATELGERAANFLVPHANGLIAADRVEEALPLALEAVDKLLSAAHLRFWLGGILRRLDRLDEAVSALESAVLLDPRSPGLSGFSGTACRDVQAPAPEGRKLAQILRFVRRRAGRESGGPIQRVFRRVR